MPDTGAPWNIPYVEPSDLVRNYPAASQDLADAVAAGLSAAGNAGIGSNVVQAVKTDVFTASVASGAVSADVTGLTATITPSSDTAKILVIVSINMAPLSYGQQWTLYRGGSPTAFIGDADGVRLRVSSGHSPTASRGVSSTSGVFLDSPATASAVTYSIRLSHERTTTETIILNRSNDANNSNNIYIPRSASSLVAIEVAV